MSMDTATSTKTPSGPAPSEKQIIQNYSLVWIDPNFDESKEYYQNILMQLRSVIHDVHTFVQQDEAINFLILLENMKAFFIVPATIAHNIVDLIDNIPQVYNIYIVADDKSLSTEEWIRKSNKIQGLYTDIKSILEPLSTAAKQCDQDAVVMSSISMDKPNYGSDLDFLDPSFMYSKLLKEILLEMEYDKKSIESFILFLRNYYTNQPFYLNIISQFERTYKPESAIWWYTRKSFIYEILNKALRELDTGIIINMGFFIHDLHKQIEQLYQKQLSNYHQQPFTVYLGKGLSKTDFERLMDRKDGLMSFNDFLSTSTEKEVSLVNAQSASMKADTIGVLFKMVIDPSVPSVPFAAIENFSYDPQHAILFSTNTVFRINQINNIDNNNLLYQVDLTLTADNDEELRLLTNHIREDMVGKTGSEQLAIFLNKIGHFDQADSLCNKLLEQTSDENEKAQYYDNLGDIKNSQGDYEKSIEYYEKTREILEKTLPSNDYSLATCYDKLGQVYENIGDFSKALEYYEKACEIFEKTLPPNHPDLATSYNNIGGLYENMDEYSKALSYLEKALQIQQTSLPPNHPSLATTYNKLGSVYKNMQKFSEALESYNKALELYKNCLPPNHPDFGNCYVNIGWVYADKGEYSNALSNFKRALSILEDTLPPTHPNTVALREAISTLEKKL